MNNQPGFREKMKSVTDYVAAMCKLAHRLGLAEEETSREIVRGFKAHMSYSSL